MSLHFIKESDDIFWHLYRNNHRIGGFDLSELSELVSATQAALAEQNSRVMSGECVCELETNLRDNPICGRPYSGVDTGLYCNNQIGGNEFPCGHDAACHATRTTENQGE